MKTLGDRLKEARIKRKHTQVSLAQLSGVPQQTIQGIESQRIKETRHLMRLAKALNIDPEWLSTGEGEMERTLEESSDLALRENSPGYASPFSIPVFAITAGMGQGKFLDSEQVLKIVVFDPATLRDMNLSGSVHGIVAVYADGESMLPTIPPKSIVFVDRNQRDLRDGVYLVRLEEMIYVKRLQRLPNHKVKVISDNPVYQPFEVDLKNGDDFEILGKVLRVWIERTF
ncbi:MAG: XRE family transcriptional regulator [Leptospirales bacterium]